MKQQELKEMYGCELQKWTYTNYCNLYNTKACRFTLMRD